MGERYFNAEQEAHMRYLGSVPRERRCPSGWHVKAHESCKCIDQEPCVCLHVKSIHSETGCSGRWNLIDRTDRGYCPCMAYRPAATTRAAAATGGDDHGE
jgi:hypothetical protein